MNDTDRDDAHEALSEAISEWVSARDDDHQVVVGWILVAASVPSAASDDVLYHHAEPTQPWHVGRGLAEVIVKRLDREESEGEDR